MCRDVGGEIEIEIESIDVRGDLRCCDCWCGLMVPTSLTSILDDLSPGSLRPSSSLTMYVFITSAWHWKQVATSHNAQNLMAGVGGCGGVVQMGR